MWAFQPCFDPPNVRNVASTRRGREVGHRFAPIVSKRGRVTINSDDAQVFGRGVSEEFLALHRAGVFTAAELDVIRRWSLEPRGVTPAAE